MSTKRVPLDCPDKVNDLYNIGVPIKVQMTEPSYQIDVDKFWLKSMTGMWHEDHKVGRYYYIETEDTE